MADKLREYTSDAIVVRFDVKRCIHAEKCVKGLPAVFDRNRKPWVDPSKGEADGIANVVKSCPTGALSFSRKDGGLEETPPERNCITIGTDGPVYVTGDIELHTHDGVEKHTRLALCRCGAAQNKPFCDNAHEDIGFRHDGSFAKQPVTAELGGPIAIRVRENGSLLVEGNFQMESGDGSHAMLFSGKTWLCRCGHSENKPFCDGTHKKVGFEAAGVPRESRSS